jgi:competence protein ComEC
MHIIKKEKSFECWFFDVGQGTSSVIYLGEGQAIVIDCGPGRSKQVLQFLHKHVSIIKSLIFSHNDSDHINGAAGILGNFVGIVEKIYFLADGKHEKVLGLLNTYDPEKKIPRERLEKTSEGRGDIFHEGNIKLEIIYPGFISNLEAENAGSRRANQTSAILKLTCGEKCVIFSGDATITAWERLTEEYLKERPFECDIMTIPHHGGKITSGQGESEAQKKLYTEIIKPKYGIISVGTINDHGHPCPETISAMVESGIEVLCTQMTSQCCCDLELIRGVNRIIAQPSLSSREEDRTGSERSKNVACLGTISAEVNPEEIKINQLKTHRQNRELFSKISTFKPLCGKC